MQHVHQYVPAVSYKQVYKGTEDDNTTTIIPKAQIHPILFGGDQLTAARARGAKKHKANSISTAKCDQQDQCLQRPNKKF